MGSTLRSPALKQNFMIFVSNIFYTHGKYAEVTYSYTKLPKASHAYLLYAPIICDINGTVFSCSA